MDSGDFGFWERVNATVECEDSFDMENWADRHDQFCRTFWPQGRAGHTAVLETNGSRTGVY